MAVRKKKISFVVPAYNEEENVESLYGAVCDLMKELKGRYDHEIIFTDNHSSDRTFAIIKELAARDKKVRGYRFSRNFGYQRSILTGYLRSDGDAVVQLDCDLQDPPSLVADFLEKWEQGSKVVYGVRAKRKEWWGINLGRKLFYRTINLLSEDDLPLDAGDFRLVDRQVVEALREFEDMQPYLRGAIAGIGFPQEGIAYEREDRKRGRSKFSFFDLMALALDGILNHSIVPLRVASIFGIITSLITLAGGILYLIGKFVLGQDWPAGFATTTILILLSLSINSLFLGIIGEYLGRIYKQVKRKPLTIIEEEVNP
ncbi:MAG: glycosyltransferase family 2 protein [Deltaproteobacteria bacterium]|nr:glycosyltransferase family 2 protein [Deltaproteobacteria bacterium]